MAARLSDEAARIVEPAILTLTLCKLGYTMASHHAEPAQQQNFPQLAELEPPRRAEDGRPAVSAAFTSSIAAHVLPALANVTTLFELFW